MFEKVIIVKRKTRLEELIEKFNSRSQAKFYIEHAGADFNEYQSEHDDYCRGLDAVQQQCASVSKLQVLDRSYLPTATITPQDVVVTVGQDGLVANTAKYIGRQPLIAVNPDPARIDGILCKTKVKQVSSFLMAAVQGNAKVKKITLAKAALNDGQELLAFNDFFVGVRSHTSARYSLKYCGDNEEQSSSGIIISTGAGSTGWLSSLFNMGNAVTTFLGGQSHERPVIDWSSNQLLFVVREPFKSRHSNIKLTVGVIDPGHPLVIESHNPVNGTIFSDGLESDYLEFNSGRSAQIAVAEQKTHLIVGSL